MVDLQKGYIPSDKLFYTINRKDCVARTRKGNYVTPTNHYECYVDGQTDYKS